ncbi:MAG: SDR family oxidoreductase [Acidobacteria bacterium]|nr:MAG: SDR family oxidoreductase [Acidobacteriota bacterium]
MSEELIVITGVTRGLGRAMARGMAAAGHRILGCGRTEEELASLRRELGEGHDLARVDVADAGAVEAWAAELVSRFRAPDLVLSNAALINRRAPLWRVPADELSRVVDVNLKGVAYVARAFLPAMIERGRGLLVNFSSGYGRSTAPEVAPYCATKFAVEGLTGALAQELPPGLGAIALSPGIIHTEMLDEAFGAAARAYPSPAEWAEVAVPFILDLTPADNGRSLSIPQP